MKNILSSIIDFGAREDMGMDIDEYEKKRQGGTVSGAGNLTTQRFNADLKRRQRESQKSKQTTAEPQTKDKTSKSKTDSSQVDIGNISTKDIMDKSKVSEEEVKKIYDKLYEEGAIDPNLEYKNDYYDQRLIVRDYLKNKGS